eukprot:TRINITY_DN12068_c2_g3_i2.p1 TRINITY_DN12068_c2_g3~~TRINITY_DN12068_c2_g3_i2.p1  ORF type:complete len:234 (+),score=41.85 TRINITY_DN12068_c2_g3_i2:24-725(+)
MAVDAVELNSRIAELEASLKAKEDELLQAQSDLRVSNHTIRQLESEVETLSKAQQSHTTGHKKKKKGKKKKKLEAKSSTADTVASSASQADVEEVPSGELITYELIARKFPDIKLAEVLSAERTFTEADESNDGRIDVTELDKWLTKESLIFSVSQVTALLLEMDVDGDDSIDFLEFLEIIQELKQPDKFQASHESMAPTTQAAFASIRRTFLSSRRQSAVTTQEKSKACVVQ